MHNRVNNDNESGVYFQTELTIHLWHSAAASLRLH